jgi:hypothetical protein
MIDTSASTHRAMPKSISRTSLVMVSMMLLGLMSRWTTPRVWA